MALDTTNIHGPGRGEGLLADGIVKLLGALAAVEKTNVQNGPRPRGTGGTLSIKGEATIDWSDKRARSALLAGIVADACGVGTAGAGEIAGGQ